MKAIASEFGLLLSMVVTAAFIGLVALTIFFCSRPDPPTCAKWVKAGEAVDGVTLYRCEHWRE